MIGYGYDPETFVAESEGQIGLLKKGDIDDGEPAVVHQLFYDDDDDDDDTL